MGAGPGLPIFSAVCTSLTFRFSALEFPELGIALSLVHGAVSCLSAVCVSGGSGQIVAKEGNNTYENIPVPGYQYLTRTLTFDLFIIVPTSITLISTRNNHSKYIEPSRLIYFGSNVRVYIQSRCEGKTTLDQM